MKKPKQEKGHYTLDAWEAINGELNLSAILPWVDKQRLSYNITTMLIEEFKLRMLANGNVYADFRAAFKVWFMKGYLNRTMDQARIKDTGNQLQTVVFDKGVRL